MRLGGNKADVKIKEILLRKKVALRLLQHRLGQISNISLIYEDTENSCKDIELRIHPYIFCTLCQISSMSKDPRAKKRLKPKASFKWVFINIIPGAAPKVLTRETTFSNYLWIFDAYSKVPILYDIDRITIEEVIDKLDMF